MVHAKAFKFKDRWLVHLQTKFRIMNINNIEQITHILIKDNDKNFLFNDCEYIFKEKGYLFYDLRKCS